MKPTREPLALLPVARFLVPLVDLARITTTAQPETPASVCSPATTERTGFLLLLALVLCSIRTRYTADRELCNNANPSRGTKTTTCSGTRGFGPRDSGIIMQQSRCYCSTVPLAERLN